MFPEVAGRLIKVVNPQEWLSSIHTIPISRLNETSIKTKDKQSATLEATSYLMSLGQVDLIELPCLKLHGWVVTHPPVTWSSLESAFRGVLLRSLGELGACLVQEEGLMNWSLEMSIQLSADTRGKGALTWRVH